MKKGFIRLWLVLSFLFVPGLAFWQFYEVETTWNTLDQARITMCVDREGEQNFDVDKCIGPPQTVFQHEQTTPSAYWAALLGWSFVAYLFVTAILLAIYYVGRWVLRGFTSNPQSGS